LVGELRSDLVLLGELQMIVSQRIRVILYCIYKRL